MVSLLEMEGQLQLERMSIRIGGAILPEETVFVAGYYSINVFCKHALVYLIT